MTEYIILREETGETPDLWHEYAGKVKASSAKRALAEAKVNAGVYVAIPVRSWKPLTVAVEQTTKVTIG